MGPKKLAVACSTALVTSVLVVAGPMLTTPATAAEILVSGGFEGGPPWSAWTQADSAFVTPICDISICTTGGGGATAPRTGECWAWFGGNAAPAGHTSSISQTLTIPEGIPTLTYWFRNGLVSAPFDAALTVTLDDATLVTHTEASSPEATYTQQTFDLSPYADGDQHTLTFAYAGGGAGSNGMTVDDISIDLDGFPVATAGDDQVVSAGDTVTLDGSGSSDPDGPLADVSWEQTSGPEVTLASEETLQPTFTAPAGGSVLTFELTVADGSGNFDTDEVTVSVNRPPLADAGDDQLVNEGDTVTLDGTGSSDPDLDALEYSWDQNLGDPVVLTGATTAQPTFTAPAAASTLTFELTVDDGNGADDTDSVTITVADTTAPDTAFTTQPPGGVAKSLTVLFAFASSEPGTFSCALDTTVFTSCTSPTTLTVAPGPHVFRVAATDAAAQTDPTPASSSFIAYDCTALDSKAAKAHKKVTKLKRQIKNTADPDRRAKLKKKLKRAKQALKAADAAAQPCRA
jgi:hypothetical protein